MERLVFNTAEHKLEELEKYGFVKGLTTDICMAIYSKYDYVTVLDISCDENFTIFAQTRKGLCVLFDLIKDGLVVKEKKDDKN